MEIRRLHNLGVCQTNCYIVVSDDNTSVLIDAPEDENDEILKALEGTTLKKILLTHGHFDHIFSAQKLVEKTGATVFVHTEDMNKLKHSYLNLSAVFGLDKDFIPINEATAFNDGDIITEGNLSFRVIHTPGHTSGSVCFVIEDYIFTGDTLFKGSRGRTDLIDANLEKMNNSLKILRDFTGEYPDYNILAGHGKPSTLNEEKENNVYLLGFDYDDMF